MSLVGLVGLNAPHGREAERAGPVDRDDVSGITAGVRHAVAPLGEPVGPGPAAARPVATAVHGDEEPAADHGRQSVRLAERDEALNVHAHGPRLAALHGVCPRRTRAPPLSSPTISVHSCPLAGLVAVGGGNGGNAGGGVGAAGAVGARATEGTGMGSGGGAEARTMTGVAWQPTVRETPTRMTRERRVERTEETFRRRGSPSVDACAVRASLFISSTPCGDHVTTLAASGRTSRKSANPSRRPAASRFRGGWSCRASTCPSECEAQPLRA